jgi:hypothetical protein
LWGNELIKRGFFPTATELADVIGIDLYFKQFVTELAGTSFFTGPNSSSATINKLLETNSKPVWVTELQAEPWEKNETNYKATNPGSISPKQLQKNLKTAQELSVQEIDFWGLEYWLWRDKNGDSTYLDYIKETLKDA